MGYWDRFINFHQNKKTGLDLPAFFNFEQYAGHGPLFMFSDGQLSLPQSLSPQLYPPYSLPKASQQTLP